MESKHSLIAKSGNAAERTICNSSEVKQHLEKYFGKTIESVTLVSGRKKSDICVLFQDDSVALLQVKNGKGNNRGWSIDRRPLHKLMLDVNGKTLVNNVCLKKSLDRPYAMSSASLLSSILCGDEEKTKPTHILHSIFNSDKFTYLSIAPIDTVLTELQKTIYTELVPKRTCVHISPYLYFQRKGGGSKDSRPNDIQTKFKDFPGGVMHCLYDGR